VNKIKIQMGGVTMNQVSQDTIILSNGGVELLRKKTTNEDTDTVLAIYENTFAVWTHYKGKNMYGSGAYFGKDLQEALDYYNAQ
jgi:hypothetical protein